MSIIAEIYQLVNSGVALADAIPAGADLAWWERRLATYNPNAKPRKPRKQTRERNRKRVYFPQNEVWGLATAQLVSRVNDREIPFDGRPGIDGSNSTNDDRVALPVEW